MTEKQELTYEEKLERDCHICGAKKWSYCSGIPSMNEAVHNKRGSLDNPEAELV